MKHNYLYIFIQIVLISFSNKALGILNAEIAQKKFNLIGHIKGLPSGTEVFLVHNKLTGGGVDTLLQTKSEGEYFSFSGLLPHEGEFYFIKFKNIALLRNHPKTTDKYIRIALESRDSIILEGEIDDLSMTGIRIQGSITHKEYVDYFSLEKKYIDSINLLAKGPIDLFLAKKIDRDTYMKEREALTRPIIDRRSAMIEDWIQDHPSSYFTSWIILTMGHDNKDWMEHQIKKLTTEVINSYYGLQLDIKIKQTKKIAKGAKIQNFSCTSPMGLNISLNEVTQKGRYTILYFWATWCTPCLSNMKTLRDIYSRYKDKGINIVAYSIDNDENKWKDLLSKEQFPWYQTKDIDKFAKREYGIDMIPYCLILNNESQIIENDISVQSLGPRLLELLHL